MKKSVIILLFFSFILCACENQVPQSTTSMTELMQVETVFTDIPIEIPTQQPTLSPTEPTNMLDVPAGSYSQRFIAENTGEYMDYWIHVPENAQKNMPIVVFLHGSWEIGRMDLLEEYGIVSVTKDLYGENFPFLLVLPCTHESSWTVDSVPETLKAVIEKVCTEYVADPDRIIITGHSLGSIGTWNMISLYGDFFSAAVPISCGIDEPMDFETCAQVPVMAFSGTIGADETNYSKAMHALVSKINEAGGNATMNTVEGADHEDAVTDFYTMDLFAWMISQ